MKKAIASAKGKLVVFIPGMGSITSTFLAGIFNIRKGLSKPFGSLTEMGHIRLGKRTESKHPKIKDFVPLTSINDLEFAGWDIFDHNMYKAAIDAGVIRSEHIDPVKSELEAIKPMPAVFDSEYVKNISGPNVKKGVNKMDMAQQLIDDMKKVMKEKGSDRAVMVWNASTEAYHAPSAIHESLEAFEKAMKDNDPEIAPSSIYAYAALTLGIPFINGAPNFSVDIKAIQELANKNKVPIAGKDWKTGQTLMKTIIGPGLKTRLLGLNGWFSTNILGNRDGEVLDDPSNFKTKEVSKLSVLDSMLDAEQYPELYGDYYHKVRINYYPPRGDEKEAWDNIDIFGWLGMPMQIKINFLCRDSILAAPIVLDTIQFIDLAQRAGFYGTQEWMSFYFKSPMVKEGLKPYHDIFIQKTKLENTLRHMMGEELITRLGNEYYE
ncbi:MAG: inositol-3-phosphate synthase [Spirochaetes bacterium]|nr:inositol-3-phosphate synthase [Spirochaetota bacterium]